MHVMMFVKLDVVLRVGVFRGGVGQLVADAHTNNVVTAVRLLVLGLVIVSAGSITLGRADHDGVRQVVVMQ